MNDGILYIKISYLYRNTKENIKKAFDFIRDIISNKEKEINAELEQIYNHRNNYINKQIDHINNIQKDIKG